MVSFHTHTHTITSFLFFYSSTLSFHDDVNLVVAKCIFSGGRGFIFLLHKENSFFLLEKLIRKKGTNALGIYTQIHYKVKIYGQWTFKQQQKTVHKSVLNIMLKAIQWNFFTEFLFIFFIYQKNVV